MSGREEPEPSQGIQGQGAASAALIAHETAREDIHVKRTPFERLATAAERPVATSQREMEKFPFVVRSGTRLVFFWMSADRHDPRPRWRMRLRTYAPAWTEAEASWGPARDLSQTGTLLEGGPVVFHAAVDEAGEIWAASQRFRRDLDPPQWAENVTPVPGAQWIERQPSRRAGRGRRDLAVLERCQRRRQPG